jgi:hypothetical protein
VGHQNGNDDDAMQTPVATYQNNDYEVKEKENYRNHVIHIT